MNFVLALTLLNSMNVRGVRVVLTLYAISLGAQPFTIGVLAATFGIFPVLVSWLTGRLVDRFGSRWLLMFGAAVAGGGILLPCFIAGLPMVFVAAALGGLAGATYQVALQNLVGQISKPEDRAKNFSNFSLAGAIAAFLGPVLVGVCIDHLGYTYSFVAIMLPALACVVMLALRGHALPGGSLTGVAASAAPSTLRDPGVWRVMVISSLAQCGMDIYTFYLPVYGHDAGLSASVIGMLLSLYAAASFVVRLAMPRLLASGNEESVLTATFYLSAVSFMLLPFFENVVLLAVISFAFGLGVGGATPLTMMLMYKLTEGGRSGEAMGLRLAADNFARLTGPLLFGALASALGLGAVFWGNALMLGWGGWLSRAQPVAAPVKDVP